jgi:hypothetical protein
MTSHEPAARSAIVASAGRCRPGSTSATSNCADQLGDYLASQTARAEIADNALEVLRRYLGCDAIVDEMELCSAR